MTAAAQVPASEQARLEALISLRILDTAPERRFDRLTDLAADLFDAPVALVSLIDEQRQWFKSCHGIELVQTPRTEAMCDHAIRLAPGSVMVVPDATQDSRFANCPSVVGPTHVRFYAGAVLTTAAGHNVGTLCILDTRPRPDFGDAEQARLRGLAELVMEQLELSTERDAADEKRRLLELAETVSHVGHWRWRPDTGEIIWSDEVYRIYGMTPGRPVDKAFVDRSLGANELAETNAFLQRVLAEGRVDGFETTITRADGETRRIVTSALRQVDAAGRPEAVFGVVQDITDRHSVIERLRRSENRYRLLADHMGDVVTRLKLNGRSNYISPAIEGLIGFTPEEMIGRPAQAFLHPDDQPELLRTFAKIAGGARRVVLQHRAMHKDGRAIWVETTFQAVVGPRGRPTEMIAVIRDVSERHRLEAELREAVTKAEQASEAKSHFLANMSHELRTPLTSVIGFSTLLQAREGLGPVERRFADRINLAGKALLSVINDILDFSKLEAGGVTLDIQPFELRRVISDSIEIVLAQIEQKGLWYACEIAPSVPARLEGDPARMRQVLLNLLGNAIKFTDQGGVSVAVTAKPADAPGVAIVRISVTDTGIGIEPAAAAQLFERFTQVDETSARRHGGSGLGLAISRQLVELMNGRIGVDSQPGQGSTFWIEAPLAVAE